MLKFLYSFIFIIFFSNFTFAQKIDKSKEELKTPKEDTRPPLPTEPINQTNTSTYKESNDTFGIGNFILELGFYITLYTTIGDYKNEDHLHNKLNTYPTRNQKGNYTSEIDSIPSKIFRIEIANDVIYSDSKSYGNHLKLNIRPFQYFYFQTNYRELFEKNTLTNNTSNLSFFQFNLMYDRLRFEKWNVGWNLGVSYIGSGVNKAGLNYGLNGEVFPFDKTSIYISKNWSTLNNQPINSFEAKFKYHHNKMTFNIGYEHLKIATPIYNYFSTGIGYCF